MVHFWGVKEAETTGIAVYKSESSSLLNGVDSVWRLARFCGLYPGLYMLTLPLECILIPSETVSLSKS